MEVYSIDSSYKNYHINMWKLLLVLYLSSQTWKEKTVLMTISSLKRNHSQAFFCKGCLLWKSNWHALIFKNTNRNFALFIISKFVLEGINAILQAEIYKKKNPITIRDSVIIGSPSSGEVSQPQGSGRICSIVTPAVPLNLNVQHPTGAKISCL